MNDARTTAVMFADMFGGWEMILIFTVVLLFLGTKNLPSIARGLAEGIFEFRKATRDVQEDLDDAASDAGQSVGGIYGKPALEALTADNQVAELYQLPKRADPAKPRVKFSDQLIVFLAQGFGVGRIPFAPGTWGSVLGVLCFYAIIFTNAPWVFVLVPLVTTGAAVWICGRAARILGDEDPPSVVLDEIVAVPLCFFTMLLLFNDLFGIAKFVAIKLGLAHPATTGGPPITSGLGEQWPTLREMFFTTRHAPFLLGLVFVHFLLFRLFDIWKPWPVRQSQRLPGGWGVVVDDVLAAGYVNLVVLAGWAVWSFLGRF